MDALTLLRKDHTNVKSLFTRFDRTQKTEHDKRDALAAELRRAFESHSILELEILYPALKARNSDIRRLISEAVKDHKQIAELIQQLARLRSTDRAFDEKFETLIEHIEYYIDEEEGEIFRFAEENCSPDELQELGRRIHRRKEMTDSGATGELVSH